MTRRTPTLETALLDGLAVGRTVHALCRAHGIAPGTAHRWRRQDRRFAVAFAQARGDRADMLPDDCLVIADTALSVPLRGIGERIRFARARIAVRVRLA